jgi:hypothetical protein
MDKKQTSELAKAVMEYHGPYSISHEAKPKKAKDIINSGRIATDRERICDWVVRGMSSSDDRERNGRLWASDVGLCEKRAVLNATKENGISIATATNNAYFKLGIEIEEIVLDALFKKDKLLYKDYRLPDIGLNLGGRIDGIVFVGGKIRVLEVKSCGAMPSKPKPTHAAQAAVYAAITGLPATVLYFSRNVAKFDGKLLIDEFDLEPDETKKREVIFRIVYSQLAVDEKIIPNKPLSITSKGSCGYCNYTNDCWGEDEINYHYPKVTPKQHLELLDKSNAFTDKLLATREVEKRRNGVLNFIKINGNEYAKKVLTSSNWKDLLD